MGANRSGTYEDQILKEDLRSDSLEEDQSNMFDEWAMELSRRGVRVVQVL